MSGNLPSAIRRRLEIAKQLNISENTVKVQLHRGVERVKQAFSDREGMLVWLTLWQIFGD